MSGPVLLIVELAARPGHEDAVLSELRAMEAASRAEEGCREYTMLRSLSAPGRFVVYEIWESAAHLEDHRGTPHYRAFGGVVAEHFAGPPRRLEMVLAGATSAQ